MTIPVSLEPRCSLVRSKIGRMPDWHAPSCTQSPGSPENQVSDLALIVELKAVLARELGPVVA